MFERDDKYAGEWEVSRHKSKRTAIAAAEKAYRTHPGTYGVDLRDSEGDLIEEIGLINTATGGEFAEHMKRQ